jgi:hypothetical protein
MIDVSDDGNIAKIRASIHAVDCLSAGRHSRKRRKGRVKVGKLATAKPKKKCCRSKPRCKRCPVVLSKVEKAQHVGIRGKELEKVYKRARKS